MDDKEFSIIKARAEANDPNAMFLYAEYVRAHDPAEADKYILLAAYLGQTQAVEKYGDICHARGDFENAMHFYKRASRAGSLDCAVKLAVMRLSFDEYKALHELEELAESGVKSACSALAAYYKSQGNRKQASFWQSLIK